MAGTRPRRRTRARGWGRTARVLPILLLSTLSGALFLLRISLVLLAAEAVVTGSPEWRTLAGLLVPGLIAWRYQARLYVRWVNDRNWR